MNSRLSWGWKLPDRLSLFFPDNTVLNNFAILHLMDELGKLVGARGSWCATVAQECAKGAKKPGLKEMEKAPSIFGIALYPIGAEFLDTQVIRERMLKPGDQSTSHLGEAETIAIMTRRQLKGFFVTDDRDAAREANAEGIKVVGTWDILRLMTRVRLITVAQFHVHAEALAKANRGYPPGWPDKAAVELWLHPPR
jgi:predicted nucleic acid-binding protein